MGVLVFCYKGHGDCLRVHFLRAVQYPSFLANLSNVFYHAILHNYEETNKAYDQIQIYTVHIWEAEVPGERRCQMRNYASVPHVILIYKVTSATQIVRKSVIARVPPDNIRVHFNTVLCHVSCDAAKFELFSENITFQLLDYLNCLVSPKLNLCRMSKFYFRTLIVMF